MITRTNLLKCGVHIGTLFEQTLHLAEQYVRIVLWATRRVVFSINRVGAVVMEKVGNLFGFDVVRDVSIVLVSAHARPINERHHMAGGKK